MNFSLLSLTFTLGCVKYSSCLLLLSSHSQALSYLHPLSLLCSLALSVVLLYSLYGLVILLHYFARLMTSSASSIKLGLAIGYLVFFLACWQCYDSTRLVICVISISTLFLILILIFLRCRTCEAWQFDWKAPYF